MQLLLNRLAQDVFYVTHELPAGILIEADVFIEKINDFKYYWQLSEYKEKWMETLNEWIFIGNHWKTYSQ